MAVARQNPASAAPQFDGNGERQELPGDTKGLHVSESRRIARQLTPGFMQEDCCQQEAAGERRRLHES